MAILWITLFIVTILTLAAEYFGKTKVTTNLNGEVIQDTNPNKFLFFVVIMALSLLSGLRSSIGDTGYYMYSYSILTNELNEVFNSSEGGFILIQLVLKNINSHPQFLLLITSFITITLILKTLFKYSRPLSLGIFLFVASGVYVSTMNGLRQFLVAAILFYSINLIVENKKLKYFSLVVILSTIHTSALLMIPIYFIVRQEPWSKRMVFLIGIMFCFFIGFNSLFGFFSNIIENTTYGHYVQTFGTEKFEGANWLRIIVATIPVVFSYVYRKRLSKVLPNYNIYVNFAVLNLIVILFASYNWVFARLGIYFELYNFILLPAIIKYSFNKKLKILVGYVAIACYIIFFYYTPHNYASYFLKINTEIIGPLTRSLY